MPTLGDETGRFAALASSTCFGFRGPASRTATAVVFASRLMGGSYYSRTMPREAASRQVLLGPELPLLRENVSVLFKITSRLDEEFMVYPVGS